MCAAGFFDAEDAKTEEKKPSRGEIRRMRKTAYGEAKVVPFKLSEVREKLETIYEKNWPAVWAELLARLLAKNAEIVAEAALSA